MPLIRELEDGRLLIVGADLMQVPSLHKEWEKLVDENKIASNETAVIIDRALLDNVVAKVVADRNRVEEDVSQLVEKLGPEDAMARIGLETRLDDLHRELAHGGGEAE